MLVWPSLVKGMPFKVARGSPSVVQIHLPAIGSYSVVVITADFGSANPSSILGGTL